MKRSEMLEVMDKAVSQWHLLYVGNTDGYTCNKHILKKMEEAGMLPPPDLTDIRGAEKETGVVLDISYNNPLNDDYSLNLWEKE
jgi:hypothetical protein